MRAHVVKSKQFELDKVLIKQVYKKKDKKQRIYKINKKNIVYDKQITENYNKYSNNNRNNYFSSYQSFRDYISSGYNYDFLVNEINNIKTILGYSHSIRELVNKKMNPEKPKYKKSSNYSNISQIIELNEESNSNSNEDLIMRLNNPSQNKVNKTIEKRASTVFQIDKKNPFTKKIAEYGQNGSSTPNRKKGQNENFIQNCKLLKLKEEEIKGPQNQYQFRLFSALSEDFDPFFLPEYENFMKVKYENQKTKLIKLYNQEKAFIECVTLIKNKLKSHLNMEKNEENKENINVNGNNNNHRESSLKNNKSNPKSIPQYIFQLKIPYINAFYFGRTESCFKDIDNFMSMYKENTSLESKRQEIDFFTNLYQILTFNNYDCKKFLQYLYSNSYFFKYIYDIFTVQNKMTGITIKNFAPSIKKFNEEDHFLNDSMKQLFFTEESKAKTAEEEKNKNNKKSIIESDDFIESLLGNEFIYTINICEENVSDYINNKKTNSLKKLLSNNLNFNQNYIISLNSENLLNIYNTKKYQKQKKKTNLKTSKYLLSVLFDEKVNFYDLEKDLKNSMNIEIGKKKSEKILLIGVKQSAEKYSHETYKEQRNIRRRRRRRRKKRRRKRK